MTLFDPGHSHVGIEGATTDLGHGFLCLGGFASTESLSGPADHVPPLLGVQVEAVAAVLEKNGREVLASSNQHGFREVFEVIERNLDVGAEFI